MKKIWLVMNNDIIIIFEDKKMAEEKAKEEMDLITTVMLPPDEFRWVLVDNDKNLKLWELTSLRKDGHWYDEGESIYIKRWNVVKSVKNIKPAVRV